LKLSERTNFRGGAVFAVFAAVFAAPPVFAFVRAPCAPRPGDRLNPRITITAPSTVENPNRVRALTAPVLVLLGLTFRVFFAGDGDRVRRASSSRACDAMRLPVGDAWSARSGARARSGACVKWIVGGTTGGIDARCDVRVTARARRARVGRRHGRARCNCASRNRPRARRAGEATARASPRARDDANTDHASRGTTRTRTTV
jgi:hypothetical protein